MTRNQRCHIDQPENQTKDQLRRPNNHDLANAQEKQFKPTGLTILR